MTWSMIRWTGQRLLWTISKQIPTLKPFFTKASFFKTYGMLKTTHQGQVTFRGPSCGGASLREHWHTRIDYFRNGDRHGWFPGHTSSCRLVRTRCWDMSCNRSSANPYGTRMMWRCTGRRHNHRDLPMGIAGVSHHKHTNNDRQWLASTMFTNVVPFPPREVFCPWLARTAG